MKKGNVLSFVSGLLSGLFSLFIGFCFSLFSGVSVKDLTNGQTALMIILSVFLIAAAVIAIVGSVFCYDKVRVGGWVLLASTILVTLDIIILLFVHVVGSLLLLVPEAFAVFATVVALRDKKHLADSAPVEVKAEAAKDESDTSAQG